MFDNSLIRQSHAKYEYNTTSFEVFFVSLKNSVGFETRRKSRSNCIINWG